MKTHSALLVVLLAQALGCATPQTKKLELDPREVEAEEALQRELALGDQIEHQQRLTDVTYGLASAGLPLCSDDLVWSWGARLKSAAQFDGPWYEAARGIGLSDTVQVVAVAVGGPADQAGIQTGDRVLAVDSLVVPIGVKEPEAIGWTPAPAGAQRVLEQQVRYSRAGRSNVTIIRAQLICGYRATVIPASHLNAYADGNDVFVTTAMMRFTEDDELRVILAHEFAHNSMGHIDAKRKNATIGAIIGAVADVAIAAGGRNSGGFYSAWGAALGAERFSQDFEREADYVGMYFLAHSGFPLEKAPRFWRHMAQADPDQIGFATSHPTSAERFVLMRTAHDEISRKLAANVVLMPEMKGELPDPSLEPEGILAAAPDENQSEYEAAISQPIDPPPEWRVSAAAPLSAAATDLTAMVTREATWKRDPEARDSDLVRSAWKLSNPPKSREQLEREKQVASGLDLSPRLEHWSGSVEGEAPRDLPKVTVRLYDEAQVGEEMGAVVYWHDEGACSYALELREKTLDWLRADQVTEAEECAPQGEIWFILADSHMTAVWHRPDGSVWFTSNLKLD